MTMICITTLPIMTLTIIMTIMIPMTKIMTIMTIAHLTSKSRPEARYNAVDQSLLPLVTSLKLLNMIYIFSFTFGMITMTIPCSSICTSLKLLIL